MPIILMIFVTHFHPYRLRCREIWAPPECIGPEAHILKKTFDWQVCIIVQDYSYRIFNKSCMVSRHTGRIRTLCRYRLRMLLQVMSAGKSVGPKPQTLQVLNVYDRFFEHKICRYGGTIIIYKNNIGIFRDRDDRKRSRSRSPQPSSSKPAAPAVHAGLVTAAAPVKTVTLTLNPFTGNLV